MSSKKRIFFDPNILVGRGRKRSRNLLWRPSDVRLNDRDDKAKRRQEVSSDQDDAFRFPDFRKFDTVPGRSFPGEDRLRRSFGLGPLFFVAPGDENIRRARSFFVPSRVRLDTVGNIGNSFVLGRFHNPGESKVEAQKERKRGSTCFSSE
jgi:hypothetical protein